MKFLQTGLRLLGVFVLTLSLAMAKVPEPDHTLFGTVSVDGRILTTGLMTLVLDGDDDPIASFVLGSSAMLGTLYAIRVPMALNRAQAVGTAQAGRTGKLFINGKPVSSVTIGAAGDVQRLDFETDLIARTSGISIADASGSESMAGPQGADVKVSVNLAFGIDQAVFVDWHTVDGTASAGQDYRAQSGQVMFPACATIPACETTAEINVTIYDDTLVEGDPGNHVAGEYFYVQLSNPVNVELLDSVSTIMISDDDDTPPAFSINNLSVLEPQTGSIDKSFTVKLSHTWHEDVTVDVSVVEESADSSDFALDDGQVVIATGKLTAEVNLEVFADNLAEDIETFKVQLKNASTGSIVDAEGNGLIYQDARVLYFVESHLDDQQGIDHLGGAIDMVQSLDGDHFYVASSGDNALIMFNRNQSSGELTYRMTYRDGHGGLENLAGPRSLSLSADGRYLYAAALEGVSVFRRNLQDGELTLLEVEENGIVDAQSGTKVEGLAGAISMAISPRLAPPVASEHLYVAAYDDNAVAIFARDKSSGLLSYQATVGDSDCDGGPGVNGLCGVSSVVISGNGEQLYAVGRIHGTLAVFDRDIDSGTLSLIEVHNGVTGAVAVAISGDGLNVYVAAPADGNVVIFDRDADGRLSYRDHVGGEDDMLALNTDVAVSRDGKYVYATGYREDTLVVFDRAGNGALSYREVEREGIAGVSGLNGASALLVSADDRQVYTAGYLDGATTVFRRDLPVNNKWDEIFSGGFEVAPAQGQKP